MPGLVTKKSEVLELVYSSEEPYAQMIARELSTNYGHILRQIDELEDQGYIVKESKGHKKILETTERGSYIAERLQEVLYNTENF